MTETRGGVTATTDRVGARPLPAGGGKGFRGGQRNPWRRLSLFYREIVA